MTVTDITDVTKKQCKIMLDDEFDFVLYKGELRRYGIKQGETLDEATYDRIIGEVLVKRAKLRALNLLKSRSYTEKRLRDKLEAGKYPAACIEQAIAYVKSYGYINDEQYAADFLFYHGRNLNRLQIFQKLKQKGIAEEIIRDVYERYQKSGAAPDEEELIKNYLIKKKYTPSEDAPDAKNKLIRTLMQKGFRYDRIAAVLYTYGKNDEEIVNS